LPLGQPAANNPKLAIRRNLPHRRIVSPFGCFKSFAV
jgi:hypothetical protein